MPLFSASKIVVIGQSVSNRSMHVRVLKDVEWFLRRDIYRLLDALGFVM